MIILGNCCTNRAHASYRFLRLPFRGVLPSPIFLAIADRYCAYLGATIG